LPLTGLPAMLGHGLLYFALSFATPYGNARQPIAQRCRCVAPALQQRELQLNAVLDDQRCTKLFAWISMAFAGDRRYGNLMLAFASIFGDDEEVLATYGPLVENALAQLPASDEQPMGEPVDLLEREQGSLGAMGAGQWTGQFRTRPHALLDVRGLSSVDEWVQNLPRGCRRTLAKAAKAEAAGEIRVVTRTIRGGEPSPHSSLAHFRCVVAHEVRLLAKSPDDFFDALGQAIGRYRNCVNQAGEIREYRDADGRVIAFAQEATKGRVIRGQWYYGTDQAANSYVWFHSVRELVERAIADDGVDHADLGPSGSDAFSELKQKYGFASVADWHKVADYRGPFRYEDGVIGESWAQLDPPDWLFEQGLLEQMMERVQGKV